MFEMQSTILELRVHIPPDPDEFIQPMGAYLTTPFLPVRGSTHV